MAVATSIFNHIVLGHLMFLVTVTDSYTDNLGENHEELRKCVTQDGHQGFCLMHYNCNANKLIEITGENVIIPKQSDDEILEKCPKSFGVPMWCCRMNTSRTCGHNEGQLAEFGELTWSVALISTNLENDLQAADGYFCGGTLIHPSVVLTAAHCFTKRKAREIKVLIGANNRHKDNDEKFVQTISVNQIIKHEGFYEGGKTKDIALLQLSRPAELGSNVGTICLPDVWETISTKCLASGWGSDKNKVYPSNLAKIQMKLVSNEQCLEDYYRSFRINVNMPEQSFCAAPLKPDKCALDGGSPLLCKVENAQNVYMQYGVMLYKGCRNAVPGIYVNVSSYRDWIDKTVRKLRYDTSTYTYS